jgi:hypothetical protein
MKLFSFVEGIMLRLSVLPGLQFLNTYVTEFRGRVGEKRQVLGKYQGYVQAVRGAAGDVSGAVGGSKKKDDVSESDNDFDKEYEYEEDDDESYMQ